MIKKKRTPIPDPVPTLEELTNLVKNTVARMVIQIVVDENTGAGEKVDQIMEIFEIWLKKGEQ